MKTRIMSVLLALFMTLSAASAVSGTGSDPNDPSDGGADWDGDGLTNAEEQSLIAMATNMNNADNADPDGDGLPDGWEVDNGMNPTNGGDGKMLTQMAMVANPTLEERLKTHKARTRPRRRTRTWTRTRTRKGQGQGPTHKSQGQGQGH